MELRFEIGAFTFYETVEPPGTEDCHSVQAPVHLDLRLGDDLLSFVADGTLRKNTRSFYASVYASAGLAAAGPYASNVDTARRHAGRVEVAASV